MVSFRVHCAQTIVYTIYQDNWHTLPLPFSFSFFLFFFLLFSSPICRSPCCPSLFVLRSFCAFVLAISVCFLYRFLRFSCRIPAFLGGGFCSFAISSRRYTPSALLASLKYVFPLRTVFCLLAFLLVIYILFFSSIPLFRFRLGHRLFNPAFFLWALSCPFGFGCKCDSFRIRYVS